MSTITPKTQIALAIVGLTLLGLALGVLAWVIPGPATFTVHGYIALGLTLAVGGGLAGGLMWLAFWSARKGYDDGPDE